MATSFASLVRRRACLVLITALAALLSPAAADAAYSWPLKPFDQQHPVRGFFGDPRVGESATGRVESKTFHFGIDISAPDGTAVYAIASGRVVWESQRPETIAIRASEGSVFAYWHIVPAVRNGQYAVASKTILGRIARGWGHVHLAELVDGRYVNPLRRGALTPYVDSTRPTIHAFSFERAGRSIGRRKLAGRFDLVSETWDETPVSVPGKWANKPVMPAVVRWRILGTEHTTFMADGTRFLRRRSGPGAIRQRLRAMDTAESRVASGPVPGADRAGLGQRFAPKRDVRARGRGDRHARQPRAESDSVLDLELRQRRRIGHRPDPHESVSTRRLRFPADAPPRPRRPRACVRAHRCRCRPQRRATRLLARRGSAADSGGARRSRSGSGSSSRTRPAGRSAGSSSRSVAAS